MTDKKQTSSKKSKTDLSSNQKIKIKTVNHSWKFDLDLLTPKQLAKYIDSLEVLRLLRNGTTFSKATKLVGITPSMTKKFLGVTIKKKKGKFIARKNDSLPRKIRIYENGQDKFIQINGTKKTKLVAQYLGAVGKRIDNNDIHALDRFDEITIRDSKGKYHKFETDIDALTSIFERREEPEFFIIYQRK